MCNFDPNLNQTAMLVETDLFENVEVLRGLPVEQQDFLGRYAQHKSYGKSSFIYQPGEPADWVYFVLEGVVKGGTISHDGREVIKNLVYPGEMFGELGISGIMERIDFAGTFKAGAEVLRIPLDALKDLISRNPEIGQRMISKLGERVSRSERRMEDLVFNDARTRIIGFIKEQAGRSGVAFGDETLVNHGFTHQDMANITGTSRQLVTIVLNELRRKKLINFDRTTILVRNMAKLA
jgi:CRP/FNR family cyclic AMP-dependent transcriptional regulator